MVTFLKFLRRRRAERYALRRALRKNDPYAAIAREVSIVRPGDAVVVRYGEGFLGRPGKDFETVRRKLERRLGVPVAVVVGAEVQVFAGPNGRL